MKPVAKPLPLTAMRVTDRFFAPRIDLVRTQMFMVKEKKIKHFLIIQ